MEAFTQHVIKKFLKFDVSDNMPVICDKRCKVNALEALEIIRLINY